MRNYSFIVILLATILVALPPVRAVDSAVPSKQFQVTFHDASGTSAYTIFYYVPPTAKTGSNLTISALLYVNTLTGLKLYVRDYGLTVAVDLGKGHTLIDSVNVSVSATKWLYPGGRWGPINFSLPLSEQNTGLTPGQMARANVTISLLADLWYDLPVANYIPESGGGSAGAVIVQGVGGAPGGVGTAIPALLVVSGVVLLLVRVIIFRGRTNKV